MDTPTPQEQPSDQTQPQTPDPSSKKEEILDKVVIYMWPKTPVLYPMALFALICCLVGTSAGMSPHLYQLKQHYIESAQTETVSEANEESENTGSLNVAETSQSMINAMMVDRILGGIFLLLFAFTLFTLCLDLEVRWALVLFCVAIILIMGLYILDLSYHFLPNLVPQLFELSPMATPQFYGAVFLIWVVLMIVSLGVVRFHYVKVESNEVIVIGGLLEREQRFSTFRMHYVKDIQDVFEYYLPFVNSGRLILTFPEQRESVVIDNVMQIEKVTDQLDKISGVMQVRS